MKALHDIDPGEVLLEQFLVPPGISQNALATPPRRINEIVPANAASAPTLPCASPLRQAEAIASGWAR